MKIKFVFSVIIAAMILLIALGTNAALAKQYNAPANSTYIITPDNLQGWGFAGSGTNSFMNGPGNPPLGTGSVQLHIIGPSDTYLLYTYAWSVTPLSNLTSLAYSTYHDPSSLADDIQLPALVFNIDYDLTNGVGTEGQLIYDPYRTPGNTPIKGAWQTWNTLAGLWWVTEGPGYAICGPSNPCTLSALIASYPNIGTSGGIAFRVGSGWENGFIGNVDNFLIGTNEIIDTYDFEPSGSNNPPVAVNDSYTTNEDTQLSVSAPGVLTNDTDANGDTLTSVLVANVSHGTLSLNADGSFTYTPDADFFGTDTFTYKANDGTADSNTATVTITVTSVNDTPVANSQSVTTAEDTAKAITLTATDVDGDQLTWSIVAQPTHGDLSGTPPDLTYTPDPNYNGTDSFTFKVNDGTVDSNIATVTITITPVNDPPIANSQSLSTSENTAKAITLTASDPDGDTLIWTIISQPTHGTLTGTAPVFTYTPDLNYQGPDSFTFKVNDGTVDSNTATVTIDVGQLNNPPVANNQSITTAEDTAKPITLTASDLDGDPLTWIIVTSPTHGILTGTAPELTYTPDLNYNGIDSLTFKVNDGTVDSNIAIVTITVTPVNDAPIAVDDRYATDVNTPLIVSQPGVLINDTDVEGDPFTAILDSNPSHGSLTLNHKGSFSYTPNLNFTGVDTFTYHDKSGNLNSNIATVRIGVGLINTPPVANDQSVTTTEDTAKVITLTASDADGDPLTWIIVGSPTHGSLSGTAPELTYSPDSNYYGSDSFTFKVNDGLVDSNIATVTIDVTAVNDVPVADSQTVATTKNTTKTITLTASDVDGDLLTWIIVASPTHGGLTGTAPELSYTPDPNFIGTDSFTFKVNDGTIDSNIATVTIDVGLINNPPVANDQSVTTAEDTAKAITLTASDADGDTLTWTVVTTPTHGELSGAAPELTYTPDPNYNGPDSFTFKVNDGLIDSNTATVTINVTPVNDAPVADSQSVTTAEDTAKAITLTSSDADGDTLTWIVVTTPTHGVLSGIAPELTYTPDPNYNGPDSFTFKVNDGTIDSNIATVTIDVTPVNDTPVAGNDAYSMDEDTVLLVPAPGVLTNDTDSDGDTLSAVLVADVSHGTLTLNSDGSFTYKPDPNFFGTDTFTYLANDGTVNSNIAMVTITVADIPEIYYLYLPVILK